MAPAVVQRSGALYAPVSRRFDLAAADNGCDGFEREGVPVERPELHQRIAHACRGVGRYRNVVEFSHSERVLRDSVLRIFQHDAAHRAAALGDDLGITLEEVAERIEFDRVAPAVAQDVSVAGEAVVVGGRRGVYGGDGISLFLAVVIGSQRYGELDFGQFHQRILIPVELVDAGLDGGDGRAFRLLEDRVWSEGCQF